ncbi:hypothetical protein [Tuwongella immobilis]|uniref:Uncharacterized protein n=1 Tax=Tuwongella immobilis TaxID=692036 RepID=A0A6C2YQ00_9BACT|nr:hypothetical protein [Tuwongella immobilis]VIP02962.1 Uncharacterized protein OS=Singulisphaera acidiphila (strain ATCC BAA-1392 / DSM 18658 / VKM B-2454 / MOB10) GN=Sinac_1105 PE=4 SV=1: LTXXQ [Tuwongella immobilis]VTS02974.1 Uncharacterized protein OS=Singulisphaera acidiphila (strain ATCC BAA-1392 / DSM 18658 / VKM B-2454 / MOB10) GN=Sinac_1105 PE=4 SV=1: LTXXQ [Tuwongella immobilis]
MTTTWIRRVIGMLALVALLGLTSISEAQQPGGKRQGGRPGGGFGGFGGGFGGAGGGGWTGVMNFPGVREELKLSEEQQEEFGKLMSEQREKQKGIFEKMKDLSREERMTKFNELRKEMSEENTKNLTKVLKPEQITRLKQIYFQQIGVLGYEDSDDLKKELSLSEDQREKLKSISTDFRKDMQDLFSGGPGNAGNFEKMQMIRKEAMESAQNLLTDDQKKKWESLVGEPFEMRIRRRDN